MVERCRYFVDTVDSTDQMKRKMARTDKDPQLGKTVFIWSLKERQAIILISGPVLNIQAQKLHNSLYIDNLSAAEVASTLMPTLRWLDTQAIDPVQIIQIHNLVQFSTKSAQKILKQ